MVLIVLAILIIGAVITVALLVQRGRVTTEPRPGTTEDPSGPGTPIP
jgi:hypothetical protein